MSEADVARKEELEVHNTSPEETQKKVTEQLKRKTKKAIEKKAVALKTLKITYVKVTDLKPNDYNPNRQSEHDFELLCMSMKEDGFTQPIVVHEASMTIVDGEHRWRAAQALGLDEVPVVMTSMTPEQMKIATLRHNRARGSEDVQLVSEVLKDLQQLGALDWAADSLMMSDVEMNRMLEEISAPDALAGAEFTEAWIPDEVGQETLAACETGKGESFVLETAADGTVHVQSVTPNAQNDIRVRERVLSAAKTTEERQMAQKSSNLYRLSLVFSGEEAETVKAVLGGAPAEKILELCVNALN